MTGRQILQNWHHQSALQVITALNSRETGLSEQEVAQALAYFGANHLPSVKKRGPLLRLLVQFHNLLIYVLLAAALIAALLGHWIDFYVILAVVLVNTGIGFVQEGKAEKALDAIRHMLAPKATVIREGHRLSIDSTDLVPGDVIMLEPGDKVPADVRLLTAKGLQIQESVLTGESVAVDKHSQAVAEHAVLGDRFSMAYSGTLVTAGHGKAIVVATGAETEIGRISGMISDIEALTTPLLKQIAVFSRWLTVAILVLVSLVFAYGMWWQGTPATEMFIIVVSLAVAAIPEGLPAILTVTLAIGVQRMASRNAIIRRLPAVETLGAVSIICSDKTGTLTRNEMAVRTIVTAEQDFTLSGVGYAPEGDISTDGQSVDIDQQPVLQELLTYAVLCNDSAVRHKHDQWIANGDPMESALLTAAMKADLLPQELNSRLPRTDVIPFDAQHRFMATLNHDHQGHDFIVVKGAPERLIELCQWQCQSDGQHRPIQADYWTGKVAEIASQGQRVLAFAYKKIADGNGALNFADLEQDLIMIGLTGLIDPPRDEAIASVKECFEAGIRVKMITGDHAETARAIASQLFLQNDREVITGHELSQISDAELVAVAERIDVFARTSPEHKLRLVTALQAKGHVVAMTGDGVNDAPALKRADVGIAMGRTGTEVAKEASEMVLADDNFASIARAVREGRTVYDNLKKAILFLLPINGGESLSIMAAVMLGLTLPITPLQILWVNMVSSVALAMSLAFEPTEPSAMQRKPRRRDEAMLSGFLLWRITFVSVLFLIGIYGMFLWTQAQGTSLEASRTYAVNTLVVMEVFYLLNVRYLSGSSFSVKQWFNSKAVFISIALVISLQLTFTYAPFMATLFDSRPMGIRHGLEILAVGVALFMVLELEKWLRRQYHHYSESRAA